VLHCIHYLTSTCSLYYSIYSDVVLFSVIVVVFFFVLDRRVLYMRSLCFLNDAATTEIYTLHIVGSVRCV